MYVVAAQYYAKEGKDNEIAAILKKMIPISRAEPGCALYTVNRSVDDPRKFLLYEQYRDKSGYEAATGLRLMLPALDPPDLLGPLAPSPTHVAPR